MQGRRRRAGSAGFLERGRWRCAPAVPTGSRRHSGTTSATTTLWALVGLVSPLGLVPRRETRWNLVLGTLASLDAGPGPRALVCRTVGPLCIREREGLDLPAVSFVSSGDGPRLAGGRSSPGVAPEGATWAWGCHRGRPPMNIRDGFAPTATTGCDPQSAASLPCPPKP